MPIQVIGTGNEMGDKYESIQMELNVRDRNENTIRGLVMRITIGLTTTYNKRMQMIVKSR